MQDDEYNIDTVALVLKHIMSNQQVGENMSLEEIEKVLSRYNGSGDWAKKYGSVTIQYYIAFKNYSECGIE